VVSLIKRNSEKFLRSFGTMGKSVANITFFSLLQEFLLQECLLPISFTYHHTYDRASLPQGAI